MTDTARIRIGPADAFTRLPAVIGEGSQTYFLVRQGEDYALLSNICPHQGGAVYDKGTCFECPLHGWQFDRNTGRCLNAPSRSLSVIPVVVEDGILFGDIPRPAHIEQVRHGGRGSKTGLTIQLHSHACLEISYDGFTLLTDPWLDGPAFLGAWAPYPPPDASGADLKPDAILITHEHSDHFHEETLQRLDKGTPVYVPDFPNERLPRRLTALGFRSVRRLRFGERARIRKNWHVTAFEAASYWNDAFLLVDVDGFRIFDINDAGVNARIARMVGAVDVLAVQFSAGASGYPWTWAHLSDDQKVDISARACAGKLQLVREATRVYGASAVLPFASHFTLWHPTHRRFAELMKRNRLSDVRHALADTDTDVIDLLPGDVWDVGRGVIRRVWDDPNEPFEPGRLSEYLDRAISAQAFAAAHPTDESLSREELVAYVLGLNRVPEIALCEDVTVCIDGTPTTPTTGTTGGGCVDVSFAIAGGRLTLLSSPPDPPNLRITVPLEVLTAVVRANLSWDEAFIGYWCRFDRHPNEYHAGFWRLFQAPYFQRPIEPGVSSDPVIGTESTVAEILEAHGDQADRILRRYGLYCAGCDHSTAESIGMAARQHAIEPRRLDLLVRELNQAFPVQQRR
jgi:CMP-N-acetylneuraminate monooxygenase